MSAIYQVGILCKDEAAAYALKRSPLKAGDADIHVVSPAELTHQPQFSLDRYKAALRSKLLGQSLLVTASIPSTQTVLHQNFSTLPDGIICIADTQTSGKGRGSNTWESPMGCLMFSAYKRLDIAGHNLPFVQYVVSLAIVEAIRKACKPLTKGLSLDVRIKWPNDIYANKLKIGGILCQSVYREGAFHVIIGAGLNVNNAEPTTCLAALIQGLEGQGAKAGTEISREELLAHIAAELEGGLQLLKDQGFAPLKKQYLQSWLHTGQKVILEEQTPGGLTKIPLEIHGISETGFLTAADKHGEAYELHPDGNSLDFFAGLVRHKVRQ